MHNFPRNIAVLPNEETVQAGAAWRHILWNGEPVTLEKDLTPEELILFQKHGTKQSKQSTLVITTSTTRNPIWRLSRHILSCTNSSAHPPFCVKAVWKDKTHQSLAHITHISWRTSAPFPTIHPYNAKEGKFWAVYCQHWLQRCPGLQNTTLPHFTAWAEKTLKSREGCENWNGKWSCGLWSKRKIVYHCLKKLWTFRGFGKFVCWESEVRNLKFSSTLEKVWNLSLLIFSSCFSFFVVISSHFSTTEAWTNWHSSGWFKIEYCA